METKKLIDTLQLIFLWTAAIIVFGACMVGAFIEGLISMGLM